jgi:uncharacterized coiled-coil DUF342 family protein
MKLRTRTKTSYEEQRKRNNLSGMKSRQKAKQRALKAFEMVDELTAEIVDYKIKLAALQAKNDTLETEVKFYKDQMLKNFVFLPPMSTQDLIL